MYPLHVPLRGSGMTSSTPGSSTESLNNISSTDPNGSNTSVASSIATAAGGTGLDLRQQVAVCEVESVEGAKVLRVRSVVGLSNSTGVPLHVTISPERAQPDAITRGGCVCVCVYARMKHRYVKRCFVRLQVRLFASGPQV